MKIFVVFVVLLHVSQHALGGVVEVYPEAESVLLPCAYSGIPPEDNLRVMWTRSDLSPRFVHQRGEEGDLEEQNQRYRGRTSMMPDALDSSDFSLTLRKPQQSDSSNYSCSISGAGELEERVTDVELLVKDHQEEVEVTERAESVILPCRTTSDLPIDVTVEWARYDPDFTIFIYSKTSKEYMKEDNPYCGRTKMEEELLKSGDVSLTLEYPTDRDTGSYICTIYRDKDILRQKVVLIKVKEPFPSWAKAALVLLVLVLIVFVGFLYYFRHYFMSVQKVEVESGVESVLLPCKTTVHLPGDALVKWSDGYRKVHVYQNGSDEPEEQDQVYRSRTEMKRNRLQPGDLSLTLKRPTGGDSGYFTCSVYSREGKVLMRKQVQLTVRVYRVVVESGEESVLLPCRTTVFLPGDAKVKWSDDVNETVHVYQNSSDQHEEQGQLYRLRTEIKRNPLQPGDLSLTLKHPTDGDSGTFTCSVYSTEGNVLMVKQVKLTVRVCQVEVEEGAESVLLPFITTPDLPGDARVEWWRFDPEPVLLVHLYQNGSDQPEDQNEIYRNRTKMNKDPLKTGDLCLNLEHLIVGDSGKYRCQVWRGRYLFSTNIMRWKTVQLKVKERVQVQDQTEDVRNRSRSIDPTPLMADQSV